jgi:toxin ParE1/3/4
VEIGDYIAAENPAAARRFVERMTRKFEALAATPGMGVKRAGLPDELRMFPAGNYLVLYREIAGGVEIVRVCHGARRWQELL